jgi:hypothetical protein
VDLFPTLYAVSVTFSYRVTLARNLTASDINLGQGVGNTISLDLLTGLLSILRAPVGARKLLGIAPNGELYSNAFVSHNIYFDIKDSECPKTDAATQRCIVFLDTVAFSTSSKSEEEQGVVSRFLMSKLGASMLPASSNLVDTIDNTDIVDVFYLGDGREGRANDGVGVRTTSEVRRFSF